MANRAAAGTPIPISFTLATSIVLLVALAVGTVVGLQWSTAKRNTAELVSQRANLYADQIIKDLDNQLQPARHLSEFIAGKIEHGEIDPSDRAALETALVNSLAAAPQIFSVAYFDTRLQATAAGRRALSACIILTAAARRISPPPSAKHRRRNRAFGARSFLSMALPW